MQNLSIMVAAVCATVVYAQSNDMLPPISDGSHTFVVRFAEHPDMTGGHLDVIVKGKHIRLTSKPNSSVFPAGLVEEGILLWHAPSKQWIIGEDEDDAEILEVGGCSDGPFVIDLEQKIFWTC